MELVIAHQSGSRAGSTESFHRESVLIGRGDNNDVALDAFKDATVSAHHAEIRIESGEVVLYDMGSLNGTFLNGHVVRRAALRPGDTIGLGKMGPRLRFHYRGTIPKVPNRVPPPSAHELSRSGMTAREIPLPDIGDPVAGHPARLWALIVVGFLTAVAAWLLFR